jgi:hypothetical protein
MAGGQAWAAGQGVQAAGELEPSRKLPDGHGDQTPRPPLHLQIPRRCHVGKIPWWRMMRMKILTMASSIPTG